MTEVKPDVIETHGFWSDTSGIYDSIYFRDNYLPVVFENNLLWIRADHKDAILTSSIVDKKQISKITDLISIRYAGQVVDKEYLDSKDFRILWSVTVR